MNSTLDILKYAMEMEKQGEKFYLSYKDEVSNENAKKVFENLAKVEKEHYNILKEHYMELSKNKNWNEIDIDLSKGDEIFEEIMSNEENQIFSEDKDSNLSDMAIMRMAYLIENDFANYYEKAQDQTDSEEAKNLLKTLAKWEHKHRELFYNEFKDIMENNWFEQNFYPF